MRSNIRGTLSIPPPFAQARRWPEGAQRPFVGQNNQGHFQNSQNYGPQEAHSSLNLFSPRRPSFPQRIRHLPIQTGNATSQLGWNSRAQNLSIRGPVYRASINNRSQIGNPRRSSPFIASIRPPMHPAGMGAMPSRVSRAVARARPGTSAGSRQPLPAAVASDLPPALPHAELLASAQLRHALTSNQPRSEDELAVLLLQLKRNQALLEQARLVYVNRIPLILRQQLGNSQQRQQQQQRLVFELQQIESQVSENVRLIAKVERNVAQQVQQAPHVYAQPRAVPARPVPEPEPDHFDLRARSVPDIAVCDGLQMADAWTCFYAA